MIPHAPRRLARETTLHGAKGSITEVERVSRGFYISTCLEYRALKKPAEAHLDRLPCPSPIAASDDLPLEPA